MVTVAVCPALILLDDILNVFTTGAAVSTLKLELVTAAAAFPAASDTFAVNA